MTVFGLDIAKYQAGLDLKTAKSQGYSFCMAKCTEGTYEKDHTYDGFRRDAEAGELLFAAYHFLTSTDDPAAQARFCVSNLGDKSIPIMLDVEKEGNSLPNISHVRQFVNAVRNLGATVSLAYIPEWYWDQYMGRTSLVGLPRIVQSSYVSGSGYGSALYPGDSSSHWTSFGGVKPTILQFSSNVKYSGYNGTIDGDAFVGTIDELIALNLFKDWSDMALSQTDIDNVANAVIAALFTDIRRGPDTGPYPTGQSGNNREFRRIVREEVQALLPKPTN